MPDVDFIVEEARKEIAAMRMGHVDYDDYYDEATGEMLPTNAEIAMTMLRAAILKISNLQSHTCSYNSDDICIHCGADGRA